MAQTKEIVDCMYPKHFDKGQIIIREGDAGAEFYVAAGKIHRHKLGDLRPNSGC